MGKGSLTKREEVRRIRTGRRKRLLKQATQKTYIKPEGWGEIAEEKENKKGKVKDVKAEEKNQAEEVEPVNPELEEIGKASGEKEVEKE